VSKIPNTIDTYHTQSSDISHTTLATIYATGRQWTTDAVKDKSNNDAK